MRASSTPGSCLSRLSSLLSRDAGALGALDDRDAGFDRRPPLLVDQRQNPVHRAQPALIVQGKQIIGPGQMILGAKQGLVFLAQPFLDRRRQQVPAPGFAEEGVAFIGAADGNQRAAKSGLAGAAGGAPFLEMVKDLRGSPSRQNTASSTLSARALGSARADCRPGKQDLLGRRSGASVR